jgi:hypothetical protein
VTVAEILRTLIDQYGWLSTNGEYVRFRPRDLSEEIITAIKTCKPALILALVQMAGERPTDCVACGATKLEVVWTADRADWACTVCAQVCGQPSWRDRTDW